MSNEPLFQEMKKQGAILLIDRSGSTSNKFDQVKTIFDRMAEVCGQLGHQEYRVIFWSSPNYSEGRFVNGVMTLPFVVKENVLHTAFATAAMVTGGGTCPPLGFRAIKPEWFVGEPMVYFITDGQIGCHEIPDAENQRQLAEEIRKLPCQLTIIAVEDVVRDFNRVEQVQNSAGGDIYRIVQQQGLTGKVSKFVSYGPNGSFVQINKVKAPPGHAPYGEKYFSVLRMEEFMRHVQDELKSNLDEGAQLGIAQKLSSTLEVLTRDKPLQMSNDIVRTFSRLFSIDSDMVQYIMTGAIAQERGGQAQVFANYRAQLKNLFAQADGLLKQDVCGAVGMNNSFISPVVVDRVLTGSYRLVDKTVTINGMKYPRSGFSPSVPVFPIVTSQLTELQDQCLRQWIRVIYASFYRVHPTSDEIIYLLLGNMLRVVGSNVEERVKDAYRQLAMCILRKKRLNTIQTEYDRLLSGELPIPNSGKYSDFELYMNNVNQKLGLVGEPLQVWWNMCCALNQDLSRAQRRHCEKYANEPTLEFKIVEDKVPDSSTFDYNCIVTLEDISLVGGYRINPHQGIAGYCAPVYLLSTEGHRQMVSSPQCSCPVCYKPLRAEDFAPIGPKIPFDLPDSYNFYASRLAEVVKEEVKSGKSNNAGAGKSLVNANGRCGTVVLMKGVVGAGKSTWAKLIKDAVEARGGMCLVEGTDKYCKDGMHPRDAVNRVTAELQKVSDEKSDDIVVVIDTCGENSSSKQSRFFNVDFSSWRKVEVWPNFSKLNLTGYLAWSLRNVLLRKPPTGQDSHYLNPVNAGVNTCIEVHKKKAKALFPKDFNKVWQFAGATLDNLKPLADAYRPEAFDFVSLGI